MDTRLANHAGLCRRRGRDESLRAQQRWQAAIGRREDVRALGEANVERPRQTFGAGDSFVLEDQTRHVEFLHLGWGHTQGDGYVWLPKSASFAPVTLP